MSNERHETPSDEGRKAVQDISGRVGFLQMSYARTLVDELGQERGRELA